MLTFFNINISLFNININLVTSPDPHPMSSTLSSFDQFIAGNCLLQRWQRKTGQKIMLHKDFPKIEFNVFLFLLTKITLAKISTIFLLTKIMLHKDNVNKDLTLSASTTAASRLCSWRFYQRQRYQFIIDNWHFSVNSMETWFAVAYKAAFSIPTIFTIFAMETMICSQSLQCGRLYVLKRTSLQDFCPLTVLFGSVSLGSPHLTGLCWSQEAKKAIQCPILSLSSFYS